MYGVIAFRWNNEVLVGSKKDEDRRPWRPIEQFEEVLPNSFKTPYHALLNVVLKVGAGALHKNIPDVIKRYPTESYLAAFASNTFILENLFKQSGFGSWVIPISLVGQIGLITLLYGRSLVELSVATNEPYRQIISENPKQERAVNFVAMYPSEGGHIYKYILGNIRNRWGTLHKLLSGVTMAFFFSAFTSGHFMIGVLRVACCIPIAFFLWYKRKQNAVLERDLKALDQWAKKASTEEENRQVAREAIIRYVERTTNPYNSWQPKSMVQNLEPFYQLTLKGLRLESLPTIVSRLTSLKVLDLSNNRFSELPSGFTHNLIYLEKIDLRGNPISSVDKCNGWQYKPNMPVSLFLCDQPLHAEIIRKNEN